MMRRDIISAIAAEFTHPEDGAAVERAADRIINALNEAGYVIAHHSLVKTDAAPEAH